MSSDVFELRVLPEGHNEYIVFDKHRVLLLIVSDQYIDVSPLLSLEKWPVSADNRELLFSGVEVK